VRNFGLLWSGFAGPTPKPDKWVFIVGCYNSGTTLLHDLLASHPEVGSLSREGQYCTTELLIPRSVGLRRAWALEPSRFRWDEHSQPGVNVPRLKRQWGWHFNDAERRVLLEKTPANLARIRWLQATFENAHFIGIIRNGYAVAEGIRRKAGQPIENAALQWARSNEIMLSDFEALGAARLIRYEDLTRAPREVLQDVLAFLELDSSVIDVEGRPWSIHKEVSEIRNMNDRSIRALSAEDMGEIERAAGSMLRRLDYLQRTDCKA
jgi:hypothetical protein